MIATALLHANGGKPWMVVGYTIVVGIISAVSAATMNSARTSHTRTPTFNQSSA